MNDERRRPRHLPSGLTATVGLVESVLGQVVRTAEGAAVFEAIERIRRDMVAFRDASEASAREQALSSAQAHIAALGVREKLCVAAAYTLYLELVNACENAYRTHRLKTRAPEAGEGKARLTFVLTAHPTESRSPQNIRILRRVQDLLVESLAAGRPVDEAALSHLLHLAWRVGTHPARKPSVEDEAAHLFSLLTDPILMELVALADAGHQVLVRTWVGGDRDGHPGVGPAQTVASLDLSRTRLLELTEDLLGPVREDVQLAAGRQVVIALGELERAMAELLPVDDGDGGRVEAFVRALHRLQSSYREHVGAAHPQLHRLDTLVRIFPALVIPLELREQRGRFGDDAPIAAMMRRLAAIAEGGRIDGYARSCVVSMTCEAEDLLQAHRLVDRIFGGPAVPITPLFELPEVLQRAPEILRAAAADPAYRGALRSREHVEVMLGYSDTAKRMGMLASRVGIHVAMRRIERWAMSEGLAPIFFHGHGGSVGRGGGRIEDLAATWPPAAIAPYKYTLQGEMVERTLATPEILRSFVRKVASVQADPPGFRPVGALCAELSSASQEAFTDVVSSPGFLELLSSATPYARLSTLTIGSRPVRRSGDAAPPRLDDLRAIPWVLCWTQTRLLLDAWLGAGDAWLSLRGVPGIDERLATARRTDPLLRSYARLLAFTMAKTSYEVWRLYPRTLAPRTVGPLARRLERSYEAAMDLATHLAADGGIDAEGGSAGPDARKRGEPASLLPDRPWLEESIRYRAPMIHPLNLIQIELLAKPTWTDEDEQLFRETVTGIAAGMLTTG